MNSTKAQSLAKCASFEPISDGQVTLYLFDVIESPNAGESAEILWKTDRTKLGVVTHINRDFKPWRSTVVPAEAIPVKSAANVSCALSTMTLCMSGLHAESSLRRYLGIPDPAEKSTSRPTRSPERVRK